MARFKITYLRRDLLPAITFIEAKDEEQAKEKFKDTEHSWLSAKIIDIEKV